MIRKSRLVSVMDGNAAVSMPIRFWTKVKFTGTCWIWIGANSGGKNLYGVSWDGQRRVKAHRWAYVEAFGALGEGIEADHLCRVPLCVRPSHMEAVTKAENVRRSSAPGPLAVRTNQCKRGHEYTPENTIQRGPKHRECRACKEIHRAKYRASRSVARAAVREQAAA
jgi:hypothetical protein